MARKRRIWHGQGWVRNDREVARIESMMDLPSFATAGAGIAGSGAGKVVLLYNSVRAVTGADIITNQGRVGSCVAFGAKKAIDTLACVEIDLGGEPESWVAGACPEAIYGLSRVEIGGGGLRGQDGSIGAWAARACEEYGTLMQVVYGDVDVTRYDQKRCRQWGDDGLPDSLEPMAQKHIVLNCSAVRTYEEARDAIANGYPVTVASMQGFDTKRDGEGFARATGQWAHQMCVLPGTLVSTDRGVVAVENVKAGSVVVADDGSLKTVTDTFQRQVSETIVSLFVTGCPEVRMTSTHPVLILPAAHHGATRLNPESNYLEYSNKSQPFLKKAQEEWLKAGASWVEAGDVKRGDWVLTPSPTWKSEAVNPSGIPTSNEVAWLLGLIVADGHCRSSHKIGITLAQHEGDIADRAVGAFAEMGINATVKQRPEAKALLVSGYSSLWSFVLRRAFGSPANKKRLPMWLFNGSWDLRSVLDGIFDGDGTWRNKGNGTRQIATTSEVLLWQMRDMLLRLGERPLINAARMLQRPEAWSPLWLIRWTEEQQSPRVKWWDDMYAMPVLRTNEMHYVGPVYNLEVDERESFLAGGIIVHNCFTAADDKYKRPGLCCENSWGSSWISGPKRHDQPEGSFWVDASVVNRMLRENDSWAFSGFKGFPPRKLDWRLSRRKANK